MQKMQNTQTWRICRICRICRKCRICRICKICRIYNYNCPAAAASRGHGRAAQLFANGFPAKLPWIAENAFRRGSCLRFSVLADVCTARWCLRGASKLFAGFPCSCRQLSAQSLQPWVQCEKQKVPLQPFSDCLQAIDSKILRQVLNNWKWKQICN